MIHNNHEVLPLPSLSRQPIIVFSWPIKYQIEELAKFRWKKKMPRLNPSAVKTLSILQLNNWWIFILCLSTTFWFREVLLFKCYILLWPKINLFFIIHSSLYFQNYWSISSQELFIYYKWNGGPFTAFILFIQLM